MHILFEKIQNFCILLKDTVTICINILMSNLNFFNLYNIKYASKFDCYKVKSGNNTFIFLFIYFSFMYEYLFRKNTNSTHHSFLFIIYFTV